jgi:hypothetical protein
MKNLIVPAVIFAAILSIPSFATKPVYVNLKVNVYDSNNRPIAGATVYFDQLKISGCSKGNSTRAVMIGGVDNYDRYNVSTNSHGIAAIHAPLCFYGNPVTGEITNRPEMCCDSNEDWVVIYKIGRVEADGFTTNRTMLTVEMSKKQGTSKSVRIVLK